MVSEAIRRLEEALPDFGDRAKFHLALGSLYLRKGDAQGAERAFQHAAAKEPGAAQVHTALGNLYISKKDARKAEDEFKAAANLAPNSSQERIRLADFYVLAGNPEKGEDILRRAVAKDPAFKQGWRHLVGIMFAERKYDEAIEALDPIFQENHLQVSCF